VTDRERGGTDPQDMINKNRKGMRKAGKEEEKMHKNKKKEKEEGVVRDRQRGEENKHNETK
jgi:hypothetical protein